MSIDISRPQVGRIYDYVLGGTFNHEADRRAVAEIVKLVPTYPRWAWLNRTFLAEVGKRWAAEGRRRVLDLGSGLPTQRHFNELLPSAKILFTDVDPLTVLQGQQLLAYNSEMGFSEVDLTSPDDLVEKAEAFFGAERTLAVGCIGVGYLLSDDQVRRLMQRLHDFCAPGSVMAVSFFAVPEDDEARAAVAAAAERARIKFYSRTPEQMAALCAPWRSTEVVQVEELFGKDAPPILQPDNPLYRTGVFGMFAER